MLQEPLAMAVSTAAGRVTVRGLPRLPAAASGSAQDTTGGGVRGEAPTLEPNTRHGRPTAGGENGRFKFLCRVDASLEETIYRVFAHYQIKLQDMVGLVKTSIKVHITHSPT